MKKRIPAPIFFITIVLFTCLAALLVRATLCEISRKVASLKEMPPFKEEPSWYLGILPKVDERPRAEKIDLALTKELTMEGPSFEDEVARLIECDELFLRDLPDIKQTGH